jgi:hypothetical protein
MVNFQEDRRGQGSLQLGSVKRQAAQVPTDEFAIADVKRDRGVLTSAVSIPGNCFDIL